MLFNIVFIYIYIIVFHKNRLLSDTYKSENNIIFMTL